MIYVEKSKKSYFMSKKSCPYSYADYPLKIGKQHVAHVLSWFWLLKILSKALNRSNNRYYSLRADLKSQDPLFETVCPGLIPNLGNFLVQPTDLQDWQGNTNITTTKFKKLLFC